MINEWKQIPHAENYEVSRFGEVRNKKTLKSLKQQINPSGYLIVCLHGSTNGRTFPLHRLVAECFVPGDNEGLQVNHKDGNRTNNSPENLEFVTRSENMHHRYHVLGSTRKLTEASVRELVEFRNKTGASTFETGEKYGIDKSMVSAIFSGRTWGHLWPEGKPECLVPKTRRKNWPPKYGTLAWYRYENDGLHKRIHDLEAELDGIKDVLNRGAHGVMSPLDRIG